MRSILLKQQICLIILLPVKIVGQNIQLFLFQMLEQFEALQKQVDDAQTQLNERRSKAEAIYISLVKRGEVVEQEAVKAFDELELDAITDRKMLEEQMNKAKARFEALREKLSKSI